MKAYIFDLDGTLLDSMSFWGNIDDAFLTGRGISTPPDYKNAIMSMNLQEAALYTIGRFNLRERACDIVREWRDMAVYAYENTVRLKPHAYEYLSSLYAKDIKMAVATSLPAELYEPAMRSNGIGHFFVAVCSAAEDRSGKSQPDVFLRAAGILGAKPSECVVFEDILAAVVSAKNAGMTVYAIYDKASDDDWTQIANAADGAFQSFKDVPLP
jgi:HAD superfamily hydrolase (TIGR01509 family)